MFNKDGSYTDKADKLDQKIKKIVKNTIIEALDDSMTIEEVMYISYHAIYSEAIRCQISKRLEREGKKHDV